MIICWCGTLLIDDIFTSEDLSPQTISSLLFRHLRVFWLGGDFLAATTTYRMNIILLLPIVLKIFITLQT